MCGREVLDTLSGCRRKALPLRLNGIRHCVGWGALQVTDELVQVILEPGLRPGAADVFLDFICYSGGPLPEELLPLVQVPETTSMTPVFIRR